MAGLNYDKIDSISANYYNLGLECAKVRNLSGAIEYLKRSLEADKRNTDARNLLGLCYYECGEVVEALGAWVISRHFDGEHNLADYYLEAVQGNSVELDAMDQATQKYNRALEDALDGKNDMAVIQLKRAVSMNPNFIRAMLLLALLSLMDNDVDRAGKLVNRVLDIDRANTTALRYKEMIEGAVATGKAVNNAAKDVLEESFAASKLETDAINEEVIDDGPNVMAFVSLIAGLIIGIAVVFFLVVPSREHAIRNEYISKEKDYSENLNIKLARINALENTIAQNALERKELEEQLADANDRAKYVDFDAPEQAANFRKLYYAMQVYIKYAVNRKAAEAGAEQLDESLIQAAADAIASIDETLLKDEGALSLYAQMSDEILSQVKGDYYAQGIDAYDRGRYETAAENLEKAVEYEPNNDSALYYLGRSYQALKDYENAKKYYTLLLERCPRSGFAANARERLNSLK